MKTTIQIDSYLKKSLNTLKIHERESYNEVINKLLHERNILMIHELLKDKKVSEVTDLKNTCLQVFNQIGFNEAPLFHDYENGEPVLKEWDSFESCLNWALDYGIDEDFIGNAINADEIPLAEAVTNVYCLMNEIQAPTWSMGGMLTPFQRPSL